MPRKRKVGPKKIGENTKTLKEFFGEETDAEEDGFRTPSPDKNVTDYNLTTTVRTRTRTPGSVTIKGGKRLSSTLQQRTRKPDHDRSPQRFGKKAGKDMHSGGQTASKATKSAQDASETATTSSSEETPAPRPKKRKQSVPKRSNASRKNDREFRLMKDMIRLQNRTDNLIPRLPFSRVIREVLLQHDQSLRITLEALMALQETSELYLTHFFEDAYRCTIHRKQVTLKVNDMQLAKNLRGGR